MSYMKALAIELEEGRTTLPKQAVQTTSTHPLLKQKTLTLPLIKETNERVKQLSGKMTSSVK